MKQIDIRTLPCTAALGKLHDLFVKYRRALGKDPSAYVVNSQQWRSIDNGIKKINSEDRKAGKEDRNYSPVFNGIPVKMIHE